MITEFNKSLPETFGFEILMKLIINFTRVKNTKIVESTTTDSLLQSINNVNNLYDFQTFSFWLLMFCMRGLYPRFPFSKYV